MQDLYVNKSIKALLFVCYNIERSNYERGERMKPIHITILLVSIVAFSLLYYFIFDKNDNVSPTFSNLPDNQVIEYNTSLNLLSLGLTANDDVDGNVTNRIKSDTLSTFTLDVGVHTITYSVSDLSGNKEETSITLTVIDTISPEIIINENNKQIAFEVGSELPNFTYHITLNDNFDHSLIEENLEIDTSSLKMNTIGIYSLPVNYKDSSNNIAVEAYLEIEIVHEWTDISYFSYTLFNNNTEVRILSYYLDGPEVVYIPHYIEGIPVTELGDHSFSGAYSTVTRVNIPNTVKSIGNSAFTNNKLTSIVIPDSVETIGENAFYDNELTSLVLPSGLITIEDETFAMNNIASINLPNSLETIGENAFVLNNITNLFIPKSVTFIEYGAFADNPINNITVSTYNTSYKAVDGVLFDILGISLILYPQAKRTESYLTPIGVVIISELSFYGADIDEVILRDGVVIIDNRAFWNSSLKSIYLPPSLIIIDIQAFRLTPLESITIPENVEYINSFAFGENVCTEFTVDSENTSFKSIDGVLYSFDGTTIISFPGGDTRTTYTIPAEVSEIKLGAFINTSFTTITILGDEFRFNDTWILTGLDNSLRPTQ